MTITWLIPPNRHSISTSWLTVSDCPTAILENAVKLFFHCVATQLPLSSDRPTITNHYNIWYEVVMSPSWIRSSLRCVGDKFFLRAALKKCVQLRPLLLLSMYYNSGPMTIVLVHWSTSIDYRTSTLEHIYRLSY